MDGLAPWCTRREPPLRNGVFIVSADKTATDRLRLYWFARFRDGRWYRAHRSPKEAAAERRLSYADFGTYWRGRAKP